MTHVIRSVRKHGVPSWSRADATALMTTVANSVCVCVHVCVCVGGWTWCFSSHIPRVYLFSKTLVFPLVSANDGKHGQTVLVKENQLCSGPGCGSHSPLRGVVP